MRQFLRQALLQIQQTPSTPVARDVSKLRFKFRIEKGIDKSPNPGKIEIYNLAELSLSEIKIGSRITLKAGYGDLNDAKAIFVGDVTKIYTEKKGPDIVTEIEAGDGQTDIQTATFSRSYSPGTGLTRVLGDVLNSFANTAKKVLPPALIDPTNQLLNGGTFDGTSSDILDQLLGGFNLRWSIQDNEMKISRAGIPADNTIVEISSQSGLIGVASIVDKKVRLTALLNPLIRPESTVKVRFNDVDRNFIISKTIHEGDTHGKEWYSRIEGDAI